MSIESVVENLTAADMRSSSKRKEIRSQLELTEVLTAIAKVRTTPDNGLAYSGSISKRTAQELKRRGFKVGKERQECFNSPYRLISW